MIMNNIKYVKIPYSVLTIGQYAFSLMQNLIKVKLGELYATLKDVAFFLHFYVKYI